MIIYRGQINLRGFGYYAERNPMIRVIGKQLFSRIEDALFCSEGMTGNRFNKTIV